MRRERLETWGITWVGLATWALVALPTIAPAEGRSSPRFPWWLAAWLLFGAAFWVTSRRSRLDAMSVLGLLLQVVAVVTMVGTLCNGFEGLLLVFVAAQLGRIASLPAGVACLILQTLAAGAAVALHLSLRSALMLMPPYLGFQLFAFFGSRLQTSLAEQGRLEERL